MLPKQNWRLTLLNFKLKDFFSINKCITITVIVMSTQVEFCVSFTKINSKLFSGSFFQSFHQYRKLELHLTLKSYSCDYQYKMINYCQQKKYNISSIFITKIPWTCTIRCYSISTMHPFFLNQYFLLYLLHQTRNFLIWNF